MKFDFYADRLLINCQLSLLCDTINMDDDIKTNFYLIYNKEELELRMNDE